MVGSDEGDPDEYSTFFSECKELAFILENSNERALVLVSKAHTPKREHQPTADGRVG